MGTVWHAHDTLLKRDVAVKEIAIPRAVGVEERDAIRKRVLREARAAAALNHGNAVTVFDVIEEDGKAFIVMECISGRTLDDLVKKEGPLPDAQAIDIAEDVLSALEVAHRAGIVHRDVKPANVMITDDGRTKLADFGIASVKDDPKITASGLILGSPSYMAPEQATHGSSGPEADLWGLGATLYFALEGVPPFERSGPIPTLTAVVGDEPRPMETSSKLSSVVQALLSKDPRRRATPSDVRAMLTSAKNGTTAPVLPTIEEQSPPSTIRLGDTPAETRAAAQAEPAPVPTPSPAPAHRTSDGKPWAWVLGVGALVVVAILAGMFVADRNDETPSSDNGGRQRENRNVAADTEEDAAADTEGTLAEDTAATVPGDWVTYEDPAIGYEIAHPADWDVSVRDANNTFLSGPDGQFLQIGWRSPPDEAGPVGAWEDYEPSFAARQGDYQHITIEPTTFKGMDAAWWEMTYEGLHAVNLGFITSDGEYGMALFFNTPEADWDASQELFEQLRAGFQPPA